MASENGEDVEQETTEPVEEEELENEDLENFTKLTEYGINKRVARELIKIYQSGKLSHSELDERALNALKDYNPADALEVLGELCESSLQHVGNKSALLCNKMKNLKKSKAAGGGATQGKGPDEAKLQKILKRTGYDLDVTSGQRKYGGPPPGWTGEQPGAGHEVFCGKIPKEIFEDELIPMFEDCGEIWDLRLMMDPVSGFSRGYCFVTFVTRDAATEAVKKYNDFEIRKGKKLKVNVSIANLRLFVGNIPKNKSKSEIFEEFNKRADGLKEVITYGSADNPKLKNRGFAFLEYDTHKNASAAKRRLTTGRVRVWQCDIIVDWADPQEEPDESTMSKVKVLYVRNLTSDVTEDQLREKFGEYGKVERVKKIKDYGFVHFEDREEALKAMEDLQGQKIGNLDIDVSLAKPPSENKKKEQRKRDQEIRMMSRDDFGAWEDYYFYYNPMRAPMHSRGGSMRRMHHPEPYFEDYYSYDDSYYYSGPYGPPPMPHPMLRGRGRSGGHYSSPAGAYASMGMGGGGGGGGRLQQQHQGGGGGGGGGWYGPPSHPSQGHWGGHPPPHYGQHHYHHQQQRSRPRNNGGGGGGGGGSGRERR